MFDRNLKILSQENEGRISVNFRFILPRYATSCGFYFCVYILLRLFSFSSGEGNFLLLFPTPSSCLSSSIPFLIFFFYILRCFLQTSLHPDNARDVSFDAVF